jgi:hypothetical protein
LERMDAMDRLPSSHPVLQLKLEPDVR